MVRNLLRYYRAGELVGIGDYPEVTRVLDAFLARAAVRRGLRIPSR
jgi:GST-like protein